jgi:enamine deaminase RidA (YjgF/YER057c/UK114 family)
MMIRKFSPATVPPPFARYNHAVEVSAGARLIFCSGQLGVRPDGSVPDTVAAQAEQCFENVRLILADAGLGFADVVRVNAYVTGREHMKGYMEVRDRLFGDPPPASTLMIVAGFTREEFLVEVEVVAARSE